MVRAWVVWVWAGAFLLLISPVILSRDGIVLFAGAGATCVAVGMYLRSRKAQQ